MTRLTFILPILLLTLVMGCRAERTVAAPSAPLADDAPPAPLPNDPPPAEKLAVLETLTPAASIYELETVLVDHTGARVGLDLYRGHPVLVSMFYATCPYACPSLLADVAAIERTLPADVRADLRVLLVSFDGARDTPAVLADLASRHGADGTRWRLSATGEDQARELAAVLGIKYRKLPGGEYNHSSVIALLDREGRLVARIDGLGVEPGPMASRIVEVARRR